MRLLGKGLMATAALAALTLPAAAQAAWSKAYVVEWFEPALYYGGSEGIDKPGADCPNGINPTPDWISLLKAGGMDNALAEKYRDPEFRNNGHSLNNAIPFRGPGGVNVYDNPLSVPDAGIVQVTGKIAYGLDLDNNPNTGGFVSPDGKITGVDNQFYRVSGCILRFRGPERASATSTYSNDGMHDGVYTVVIVVSGAGDDPMNEANAKVGLYLSKDKVVKDSNGAVADGYTFRVDPQPQYTSVLAAKVTNGVVQSVGSQKITMRDFSTPAFFPKELVLEQGKLQFQMTPEGNLKGVVAGYRDWKVHYLGTSGGGKNGAGAGAIHENLGKFELPAYWRALQRAADGPADPVTGERKGISTVYSINALKAHVVTPNADAEVTVAQRFDDKPSPQ
jgi:hypothetical protein